MKGPSRSSVAAAFAVLACFVAGVGRGFAPPPSAARKTATAAGSSRVSSSAQPPGRERAEVPSTLAMTHGPRLPGSAVYPHQVIPLRFDHGQHLGLGLDCARCHVGIATSRSAGDFNFPSGAVCDDCHGQQHPPEFGQPRQCELCHTAMVEGRVTTTLSAPKALLHFDHRLHLIRGVDCVQCHGDMSKVRLATTLQLPREATCLACHDGIEASSQCRTCHPADSTGALVTRSSGQRDAPPLVPTGTSAWGMEHDLAFVEDHAAVAKANPTACKTCHTESFCQDCHAGSIRPMRIHAGDYLTLHAMDARAKTQDCQSCHRTQTFCLGCHERVSLGNRADGPFGVGGGQQFHPPGWSGPPGVPQDHAFVAQGSMATCSSCHTEDSCLACHATADVGRPGFSVSPHGQGFRQSVRCEALVTRNRRVCLKCHAPGDPDLDCR